MEKPKEFEKVKVGEETKLIDFELKNWKILIEQIEILKSAMKDEGLVLTQEGFLTFAREGYRFISGLLLSEAEKQLKKLKVSGSLINISLKRDAEITGKKFQVYEIPIRESLLKCQINAKSVPWGKNGPEITDELEEQIRAKYTYFLKNEQESEFYQNLQAFLKIYEELDKYCRENGTLPQLNECLESALTENSKVQVESGMPLELRPDVYIIQGDNEQFIINPKYFR